MNMDILRHFEHCPKCTRPMPSPPPAPNYIECPACQFRCYFNPGAAVACFVTRPDGKALFIRRAKEPALGRLAPPGGFVDAWETAEKAVEREVAEEVGLQIGHPEFLCSQANAYPYRGITYTVLDLFFTAPMLGTNGKVDLDEVQSVVWLDPLDVDPNAMAFESMTAALKVLQANLNDVR
jgi:ADP-ribose pyrophosphatase YjhB (NUDIX family)